VTTTGTEKGEGKNGRHTEGDMSITHASKTPI